MRVKAAAGQCLHFRELFVIDTTYTNVALFKPTTGSAQFVGDTFNGNAVTYSNNYGVDGIIENMDNNYGNMVRGAVLLSLYSCETVMLFRMGSNIQPGSESVPARFSLIIANFTSSNRSHVLYLRSPSM